MWLNIWCGRPARTLHSAPKRAPMKGGHTINCICVGLHCTRGRQHSRHSSAEHGWTRARRCFPFGYGPTKCGAVVSLSRCENTSRCDDTLAATKPSITRRSAAAYVRDPHVLSRSNEACFLHGASLASPDLAHRTSFILFYFCHLAGRLTVSWWHEVFFKIK